MERILSCFSNSYGASGVWTAVERIREAGIEHLELALRGHDFGGLVIPESAVVTEKADDATAQRFCEHIALHGVKVSGCNVGGADIRTREGVELTQRRIQFAGKWFGVAVVVSGAGQPADEAERRAGDRPPPPDRRHGGRDGDHRRPGDAQGPDPERRRRCSP